MFGNVMAIERALGTGIIISSSVTIPQRVQKRIRAFIEEYESVLSRGFACFAHGSCGAWRRV